MLWIEHIPKLEQNKHRKENRQFIRRKSIGNIPKTEIVREEQLHIELGQCRYLLILEVLQQTKQHQNKKRSDTDNVDSHRPGNDEIV